MPDSPCSTTPLAITRHCMQQILHAALVAGEKKPVPPLFGLLRGHTTVNDSTISDVMLIPASELERHEPADETLHRNIRTFMQQPHALLGCVLSIPTDKTPLHDLQTKVCSWLQAQTLPKIHMYAMLEMGHKGRMEIHCFEAADMHTEIPVNMQEDGTLYPQTSTH